MDDKIKAVFEIEEVIEEPVLDKLGNKTYDSSGNVIYRVVETKKQTIEEK